MIRTFILLCLMGTIHVACGETKTACTPTKAAKVASKLGVTMAENAPSAIQLLKEAQRGKKPKPYLNELLRRRT